MRAIIDSAARQKTLASEKNVVELFYENGILVNPQVDKDMFAGISTVKSYLKTADGSTRLFIFKNCVNLIREIKNYWWGDGDLPIKKDDHALDELRYYLMTKPLNKEKVTKTTIGAIILTSAGILLLYRGETSSTLNLKGVVIVLTSALLYALYIVGVKNIKAIKNMDSARMSFYVMLFGLLVYIVNLKFCTQLQILTTPAQWLFTIGLALFPTIISLETITIAIQLIGSTNTAILGALEPLTAIFFGILFFHESLTLRISIGVLLILFGVFMVISKKINFKNFHAKISL